MRKLLVLLIILSGCSTEQIVSKTVKIINVYPQTNGVLVCYEVDYSRESLMVYGPNGIPQPGELWTLQYYKGKSFAGKVADAPKEKP